MKIIIIGAGIGGLTCAFACQQAGYEVKVYEKTSKLQNIGGGILLWPHGLRYLQWLGLGDAIAPHLINVEGCEVFGHQGDKIFSESYENFYSLVNGPILPIDRSLLQQTLKSALHDSNVKLNKECIGFESDENMARVYFSDGTMDSADLIIGADGIHSVLRNLLTEEQPRYTNHCWWGGIVSCDDIPSFTSNDVYMAMAVNKLFIAWPTQGNKFMWYCPIKMPLVDFDKSPQGYEQIKTLCADWLPEIQSVLHAPRQAQSFHVPIYALPPNTPRTKGRLILLGDASHALGPILGQGASQAIEDAFVLINCIKHFDRDFEQLTHFYNAMRLPKYEKMGQLEEQAAAMMINDNLNDLNAFQAQLSQVNLAMMYQDLIPLVNEQACLEIANSFREACAA